MKARTPTKTGRPRFNRQRQPAFNLQLRHRVPTLRAIFLTAAAAALLAGCAGVAFGWVVAIVALARAPWASIVTAPVARLFQLDSASFWSAVQRDGTDYILLTDLQELERAYLAPWLSGRCGDLQLVKAFSPSTLLFRSPPDAIHPLTGAVGNAVTESVTESVAERRACDALSRYRSVGTVP